MIRLLTITTLIIAFVLGCVSEYGKDKKEKRQKDLRESFSPMSTDTEILEAYDAISPNGYIIDGDTLAMESP